MVNDYLKEDIRNVAEYLNELNLGGSRFLITGATGLLGSLLVKSIMHFNSVYDDKILALCLVRTPEKVSRLFGLSLDDLKKQNIEFVFQDVTDPLCTVFSADYVVHAASPTSSKYFMSNPVEVIDSIVNGTKNILDYSIASNVKSLVYVSSMEVYGKVQSSTHLLDEKELGEIDLSNIRSCYSEGKRLAELLCKCYSSEHNLNVCIARLSQTFGAGILPSENRVFAQFSRSVIRGEDIVLHTDGKSIGNYCYTSDSLRAMLLLLVKGRSCEAYNVVNPLTAMSISDMAKFVIDNFSLGKSNLVFDIPDNNKFGYAPETQMRLSSDKLSSLGWNPFYNLYEMYERLISYIKEEHLF